MTIIELGDVQSSATAVDAIGQARSQEHQKVCTFLEGCTDVLDEPSVLVALIPGTFGHGSMLGVAKCDGRTTRRPVSSSDGRLG
jgi:hypothetical protein